MIYSQNEANVNRDDLAEIREHVALANRIGHWRRVLAIFGDHLPKCASWAIRGDNPCNCGFEDAFNRRHPADVMAGGVGPGNPAVR